jgi:hypothetical protein
MRYKSARPGHEHFDGQSHSYGAYESDESEYKHIRTKKLVHDDHIYVFTKGAHKQLMAFVSESFKSYSSETEPLTIERKTQLNL